MSCSIDLKNCRLVDLSPKLYPGKEERRLGIRPFKYGAGETMHDVDTMSHIGAHVECPSHYIPDRYGHPAEDLSDMPLETFLGNAVFIDLSAKGTGQPVTVGDMKKAGVRKGDVVLVGNSRLDGDDRPYISAEAVKWLSETRIKMFGVDNTVMVEEPGALDSLETMATHDYLLSNKIALIENLANMDRLRKKRFFFIGLPVNVVGLDSFPIRAVAIESVD